MSILSHYIHSISNIVGGGAHKWHDFGLKYHNYKTRKTLCKENLIIFIWVANESANDVCIIKVNPFLNFSKYLRLYIFAAKSVLDITWYSNA